MVLFRSSHLVSSRLTQSHSVSLSLIQSPVCIDIHTVHTTSFSPSFTPPISLPLEGTMPGFSNFDMYGSLIVVQETQDPPPRNG